jgi:membrane-associated phospholipid phosphatase
LTAGTLTAGTLTAGTLTAGLRRGLAALWLCAVPLGTARAQSDSAAVGPLFTYRDAILAGSFALAARVVHPLDDLLARRLQDSSTQANRKLQLLASFVRTTAAPGAYVIGGTMYAAGRLADNRKLASLGLHGTEALVVGEATATLLKILVGRQRPYVGPRDANSYQLLRGLRDNDYRSFPSGHAVAAFAAAAAVTAETSRNDPSSTWLVAPLMYGGAALVGVSRMYNNQHWASDVLVGAGIGTFAGLKVVRFHDSHSGNRIDRFFLAASLVPDERGGRTLRWSVLPAPRVRR